MIPKSMIFNLDLKLKSKISVRVLAKDEQSKRIHLTVKPQLMECEALVEKSDALVGKAYKGYVQNEASSGYYVHFFNKIHSHL
jgi:ribosomal protein S1